MYGEECPDITVKVGDGSCASQAEEQQLQDMIKNELKHCTAVSVEGKCFN